MSNESAAEDIQHLEWYSLKICVCLWATSASTAAAAHVDARDDDDVAVYGWRLNRGTHMEDLDF